VHSPNEQGYSLQQGIIRKGAKIWIGSNSALRTKLILALHDSAMGGILEYRPLIKGSRNYSNARG
jgi:hypothetical protein